jgi:hypothetical protein
MENLLLSNHFASAYVIMDIKSKIIRWVGHATQIGKHKVYTCFKSKVVKGHVMYIQVQYLNRLQN